MLNFEFKTLRYRAEESLGVCEIQYANDYYLISVQCREGQIFIIPTLMKGSGALPISIFFSEDSEHLMIVDASEFISFESVDRVINGLRISKQSCLEFKKAFNTHDVDWLLKHAPKRQKRAEQDDALESD